MDTTSWLITATIAGPVVGALLSPGLARATGELARARARQVKHVAASGRDLYRQGVPLTEEQFREAFDEMQADLDHLPPPAERNEWQMQRQYDAVNRFSMLAGTFPHAYPIRSNADEAWQWYQANNPYATQDLPRRLGFRLQPPGDVAAD